MNMGNFKEFNLKSTFCDYKDAFLSSKKYLLIYLVLVLVLGLTTVNERTLNYPEFPIFTFAVVAVLGIFCILFYLLHDSDKELHKVAFVTILCFGIVCALIVPICDVSDESEHLTRAEITSRGIFIPHWTGEDLGVNSLFNHTSGQVYSTERNNGSGFYTINSLNFFRTYLGHTIFQTPHDTDKIDDTPYLIESAFEQNPFFGYLPQAIGIIIAKLLDLNVIWMLWLARICNLIFYAGVISLAIRKTPILKMPLLAIACIPISIYQAASASIDCMIISLALFAIAYFIYMCNCEEKSITEREIAVFSVICILLGLCKLTYLAFIFLLLLVPFEKFKKDTKKILPIILISIVIASIVGLMWSRYSTPTLLHSWRSSRNLVNSTLQIQYMYTHPSFVINFLKILFTNDLSHMAKGVFSFFGARQMIDHYTDQYLVVAMSLLLFLAVTLLSYPQKIEFKIRTRVGSFFIILLIYLGTAFIQLLTWAFVGEYNLGLSLRYFIPLLGLIPVALWIGHNPIEKKEFDKYAILLIVAFLATMAISFATKYYWGTII